MRDAGHISEAMAIKNFINPQEKDVDDPDEDIMDQIIAERASESLENPEETFIEVSPVKLNEALQALATLKLYEEQQTSLSVDPNFSRMLRIHERKLLKRHVEGLKQRDLRDWLGGGGRGW